MRSTRSRPKTEEKFLHAVLELVGKTGFSNLGVNVIAQKAGADKVLIYRYFGGINGLLERAGDIEVSLPQIEPIKQQISQSKNSPEELLKSLSQEIAEMIQQNPTATNLLRWKNAVRNPLTNRFEEQWNTFWQNLAKAVASSSNDNYNKAWKHAILLLKLSVETHICETPVPDQFFEHISRDLKDT